MRWLGTVRPKVLTFAFCWLGGGSSLAVAQEAPEAASPLQAFAQTMVNAERGLQVGEAQIAESLYRTVLFEGWVILGSLAEASGDLQAARSAYEEAITSAVDVRRARIALAVVLARMEEYDEAEALLRLLIAEDKNDFQARRLLSDTLADAGRPEESIQELEQMVAMNPEDLETAYFLSTAYLAEDRMDEADFLLKRIAEAIPTPQTHILIGRAYRDYNYFERARRAFETAIEMDPRVPRAHYYRATADVLDEGRNLLEPAIGYFQKELEISPGEPTASLYLGISLSEARRFEEALPHLEVASELPEFKAEALRFLGKCLAAVGRTDEAIVAFRGGLERAAIDVGNLSKEQIPETKARQLASLHFQLAQALRKNGDRDAATVHFDSAKEYQARGIERSREKVDHYLANESAIYGENEFSLNEEEEIEIDSELVRGMKTSIENALASTYFNLGVLEAKAGKLDFAAEHFRQAADLDPDLPQVQYSLGVARFNAGEFDLAVEPLTRALEEKPGDEQLEQMLALAWFSADEYEEAAELLAALPARRSNPALEYTYGVALVRSGRSEQAEQIFARLVAENSDWPELNVMLAQAHANQGDFAAAIELLERALALDPEVAEAHGTLGEIHMRKGELEEAEEALRSELESHPGDTRTMFTLATVLDMAQKPEEAMTLLRALLEIDPRLGNSRYLLGKILLTQGSLQDALEQLEAAVGLMPEDANAHYQLGQAYQKLGRSEEARIEFNVFRQLKSQRR